MQSDFLECKPCGKKFTGRECLEQHLASAKHLKKIYTLTAQPQNDLSATPAAQPMEVSSSGIEEQNNITKIVNHSVEISLAESYTISKPTVTLTCPICKTCYSSELDYAIHNVSKEHQDNLHAILESANIPSSESSSSIGGGAQFPYSNIISKHHMSDVMNQYHCKVCNITCTGVIPYNAHLASSKHKSKESLGTVTMPPVAALTEKKMGGSISVPPDAMSNFFSCDICKISCSGRMQYEAHLHGEKHKKKESLGTVSMPAAVASIDTNVRESISVAHDGIGNIIFCDICEIPCSGKIPYEAHLHGEKHRKKMAQRRPYVSTVVDLESKKHTVEDEKKKEIDLIILDDENSDEKSNSSDEIMDCCDANPGQMQAVSNPGESHSIRDIMYASNAERECLYRRLNLSSVFGVDDPIVLK